MVFIDLLLNPRGILAERWPGDSAAALAALNFPWLFAQNVTDCRGFYGRGCGLRPQGCRLPPGKISGKFGRSGKIRTCDPLVPNECVHPQSLCFPCGPDQFGPVLITFGSRVSGAFLGREPSERIGGSRLIVGVMMAVHVLKDLHRHAEEAGGLP